MFTIWPDKGREIRSTGSKRLPVRREHQPNVVNGFRVLTVVLELSQVSVVNRIGQQKSTLCEVFLSAARTSSVCTMLH